VAGASCQPPDGAVIDQEAAVDDQLVGRFRRSRGLPMLLSRPAYRGGSDAPSVKGRSVAVGTMAEQACCAAALAGLTLASDGPPCLAGRMKPRRRPRA
jgi:hypothetical protein